jgi:hypothetical protein
MLLIPIVSVVIMGGIYILAQLMAVLSPQRSVFVKPTKPPQTSTSAPSILVTTSTVPSASIIPTPSVTASSTSEVGNWKAYRNNQFGFEINVPKEFRIEESTYPLTDRDVNAQNIAYFYSRDLLDSSDTIHYFGLFIGKTRFTLEEYEGRELLPEEIDGPPTVLKRTINGINGYESYGYNSEGHKYADDFEFQKDGFLFTIALDPVFQNRISASDYPEAGSGDCCNDYDPKKSRDTYQKILSSFKMVERLR